MRSRAARGSSNERSVQLASPRRARTRSSSGSRGGWCAPGSKPTGTPMTTSQRPAFSVLRTKPRRCGHQVYSTLRLQRLARAARRSGSRSPRAAGSRTAGCSGRRRRAASARARRRRRRSAASERRQQRRARDHRAGRTRRACLPWWLRGRSVIAFDEAAAPRWSRARSRLPATIAPAQPPTPDSTATYCLPSGPR